MPLTFSPLPFNIDGFPLARISEGIAATGTWRIDPGDVNSYNEKMPAFSLLWAATSMLGGLSPLAHVEFVVVLITSLVVLPAYLFGVKTSGRRLVGFAAGLFVALFGSFLMLTSAVTKEAIGLLVFPVAVLLFQERPDPRKRALAVVLLVFLPFLHHLTTLLTLGMVASLVVVTHRRALSRGRFSVRALALDVATGPGLAIPAWTYYAAVDLPFLSDLVSHAILPPAVGVAVIVLTAQTSLFAGALPTQPAFLALLPAVAVLAAFVLVGYQIVRRTSNRANDLVTSMLVAPVAMVLFGFLRGLDAQSLVIVYRSLDFLDYALALLAAVGFVAAWRGLRSRRAVRVALVGGFLAALLATTPMAWNTPAVFGVENVTTTDEFQALALLASLGARNVTTDQRLADVGTMWFGYTTDKSLPLKLRDNESVAGFAYALVLERWTTVGAQEHPAPNVVLQPVVLVHFLESNRVVYIAGPLGDRIFLVQILG